MLGRAKRFRPVQERFTVTLAVFICVWPERRRAEDRCLSARALRRMAGGWCVDRRQVGFAKKQKLELGRKPKALFVRARTRARRERARGYRETLVSRAVTHRHCAPNVATAWLATCQSNRQGVVPSGAHGLGGPADPSTGRLPCLGRLLAGTASGIAPAFTRETGEAEKKTTAECMRRLRVHPAEAKLDVALEIQRSNGPGGIAASRQPEGSAGYGMREVGGATRQLSMA
ncbi:uncharacterized protein BJ171DRAFT_255221 [Polychytrium aggregatum]|uniref:uncharacterized protein n=1 Tax=Polychytrium aggregatum TaxID=110093 RepID=UPI0022FDB6AB|nr:uncharacterized protein BJ171DRAFT_255221 [Polychytrium aggregatum]KAI9207791.1 hypothetical protein BJ171DRAFT_255221 [Polychytrium aggregatum]